ncbi:MAG: hypothetical protein V1929_00300 [bacterium]
MQKMKLMLAIAMVAMSLAVMAQAQTPSRLQLTNTLGAVTWTNEADYSVFAIEDMRLVGVLPVDATCVVKRVTREGFTNTIVAAGVVASGAMELSETNSTPLLKGDKLVITGAGTNTGSRWLIEGNRIP